MIRIHIIGYIMLKIACVAGGFVAVWWPAEGQRKRVFSRLRRSATAHQYPRKPLATLAKLKYKNLISKLNSDLDHIRCHGV